MQPPRRWRSVLRRILPSGDRDMLMDEMDRLYRRRHESSGPRAASRWYRGEVLQFVRRYPGDRLRGLTSIVRVETSGIVRQVVQTCRALARSPGFTLLAIVTLGLGIGAGGVILGIADRALLRDLPYPAADELVSVLDGWGTSLGSLEILQSDLTSVVSVGGAQNATGMTLELPGSAAERITVAVVSPEYLGALRVRPELGRIFDPSESRPGRGRVVLLGHTFWQSHYGGVASAVGRTITLDGESWEIIGVLPPGFDFPSDRNDVWRPAVMDPSNPGLHWGSGNHTLVARMAPGATPELVRQELLRVQERVRTSNPLWTPEPGAWDGARVLRLRDARAQRVRTPLLILFGAVAVVLLVVCANVASLFLARGLVRGREFAVRSALGAGAARLAREQLLEVMVVGVAGLAAGLALAQLGLMSIRPYLPAELPGADQVGLDLRVILITAGVATLTAIGAGALPALRAAGRGPAIALRESGRGATATRAGRRTSRLLVTAQLTAAVVLVTTAGLLVRTLVALNQVDPGFTTRDLITAELHLPPGLSAEPEDRAAYLEDLAARLEADPTLTRVALASTIPFGAEDEFVAVAIDGVTTNPNDLPVLPHHRVSTGYFETTGIPLLRGRFFSASDRPDSPPVAIVDQTFVDRFMGGGEAIGQVIRYPWRGAPAIEIVGVVGPTFHGDLSASPEATVWVPVSQMGMGVLRHVVIVARAGTTDAALTALTIRIREIDGRIASSELGTYAGLLGSSLAATRLVALLLLVFAAATLTLGCVGVYGIAAFAVRQRLKEIGVRLAIGAPVAGIRREVMRDGLALAVPGCGLGLALAVPAARALDGFIFGIAPIDPVTFGAAPLVLGLATLLALYVPARRATQVDPISVLRGD